MQYRHLYKLAYNCLLDLSAEEGIYASARFEAFGCVFGRDSAVTIIKIIRFLERDIKVPEVDRPRLLEACRHGITALISLQGRQTNVESGEEPGKFIHEFRKDNYERLTARPKPWYVYPDGYLRNYDSLDSTPLTLIAIYKYWKLTQDANFLQEALPAVKKGLEWITQFGDKDGDFLLEYELSKDRQYGGLSVQSWTDSAESIRNFSGNFPDYPIAPVEVQGYGWLALKLWSRFFNTSETDSTFSKNLDGFSDKMKESFNEKFLFESEGFMFPAQALDGHKNQIKTVTGNPLLLLWATLKEGERAECVLGNRYISDLVNRSFREDLFVEDAGIRTMSSKEPGFNPGEDSYHNGSFWPKLNGLAHEGLEHWGFWTEAHKLREATLKPISVFNTPIELYNKGEDGGYLEYKNRSGQLGCRQQAWSAAATLDLALLAIDGAVAQDYSQRFL